MQNTDTGQIIQGAQVGRSVTPQELEARRKATHARPPKECDGAAFETPLGWSNGSGCDYSVSLNGFAVASREGVHMGSEILGALDTNPSVTQIHGFHFTHLTEGWGSWASGKSNYYYGYFTMEANYAGETKSGDFYCGFIREGDTLRLDPASCENNGGDIGVFNGAKSALQKAWAQKLKFAIAPANTNGSPSVNATAVTTGKPVDASGTGGGAGSGGPSARGSASAGS